jgi:6-pyruvoyl-tetrahydropterin synthase
VLSNRIKELESELKILNKTLEELISYIENPENNLKNELPGEDPDIDYLKMKYEQLADMLNEKKELLLEKELINEEINEIAEKLRKKALDEREKNLELNEKMNEYEIKLNEITRKNIASTSELSMFKAILYKLEETKEKKVNNFFIFRKNF